MNQNGWKLWQPGAKAGKYSAYENKMVVIVAAGKTRYIYLSPPVVKALGNPEHIEVRTRGSNIGLFKGESTDTSYRIIKGHSKFAAVSVTALLKKWHIESGVYDAHIEDNYVVFDTQQKPSKL